MKQAVTSLASSSRSSKKRAASFEESMRLRIGALLNQNDMLQEEVLQLRAAVHIYSEVVRRLQVGAPQRAA
jgi:hypothetical protein